MGLAGVGGTGEAKLYELVFVKNSMKRVARRYNISCEKHNFQLISICLHRKYLSINKQKSEAESESE